MEGLEREKKHQPSFGQLYPLVQSVGLGVWSPSEPAGLQESRPEQGQVTQGLEHRVKTLAHSRDLGSLRMWGPLKP